MESQRSFGPTHYKTLGEKIACRVGRDRGKSIDVIEYLLSVSTPATFLSSYICHEICFRLKHHL